MDDGWGPFVLSTGLLMMAVFWLVIVATSWSSDADTWRKECVLRGVAEYVRTDDGVIEWRWKE